MFLCCSFFRPVISVVFESAFSLLSTNCNSVCQLVWWYYYNILILYICIVSLFHFFLVILFFWFWTLVIYHWIHFFFIITMLGMCIFHKFALLFLSIFLSFSEPFFKWARVMIWMQGFFLAIVLLLNNSLLYFTF